MTTHSQRDLILYRRRRFINHLLTYLLTFRTSSQTEQELSYRQQIARQLRTQYADGIYMHKYYATSLKSRLSVTQRHWKRNHWIDHTRLDSLLMAAAPTLATQVD